MFLRSTLRRGFENFDEMYCRAADLTYYIDNNKWAVGYHSHSFIHTYIYIHTYIHTVFIDVEGGNEITKFFSKAPL